MNKLLQLLGQEDVHLRRSERMVAEAVMADPAATVHRTLSELAACARVSEPTVVRFCHAFGFRGFREFRIKFAQAVAAQGSMPGAVMMPVDASKGLIDSVIGNHVAALTASATLSARTRWNARWRSWVVPVGSSSSASALPAWWPLMRSRNSFAWGLPTLAYTDPHMQIMSAATLHPGDVVVAISHTGRTKDILQSVMTARDGGAEVIAITSPDSPLALAASLTLPVDTSEDTDLFTPMISRLAHLAVVDVLATGIALRRGRVVDENLRRLKARLQIKRLPKNSGVIVDWPADSPEGPDNTSCPKQGDPKP
jgi:RpiR family carbohydrate utilization transcriptional regulator